MNLIEKEPWTWNIQHQWGYGELDIYVELTIFGSRRICIGREGESYLHHNFCAGPDDGHALHLIGLCMWLIDNGMPKFPFCSNIKPYFKDKDFMEKMTATGYEPAKLQLKRNVSFERLLFLGLPNNDDNGKLD